MATKIEWQPYDYAAQRILAKIIRDSRLSYRAIEKEAGYCVSFARFRDIALGRRAPVRLSEFLAICDICHADPVQTLRDIITEAKRIQAEQDARKREEAARVARRRELAATAARESRLEEETLRQLATDPLSLAAYHDPHKHDPEPDNAA